MRICYLVLVYNNIEDTIETLDGIKKQQNREIDILIVDNNSSDIYAKSVEDYAKKNNIPYIYRTINDGYAGGNNYGWKILRQKYDYIFVVNNDIVFNGDNLTDKIIKTFEKDENIAIVGPTVLHGDNQKIPDSKLHELFFYKLYNRSYTRYDGFYEIPSVIGCFLAIKTEMLQDDKLFDDSFFMYGEELDLCLRIWRDGKKVVHLEDEIDTIYHKGGYSPFDKQTPWKFYLCMRNSILCTRNFDYWYGSIFGLLHFFAMCKIMLSKKYNIHCKLSNLCGFFKGVYFILSKKDFSIISADAKNAIIKR